MKKTGVLLLGAVGAMALALLLGWIWGRSGKPALETDLDATSLRLELVRARAEVLQARVDLFEANFGNASRRLERAKTTLTSVMPRLEGRGREAAAAAHAKEALAAVERAQSMAGGVDPGANTPARDAVSALEAALDALAG